MLKHFSEKRRDREEACKKEGTSQPQEDTGVAVSDETDVRSRHVPMYRVIIHNDDVNSMDHVIRVLMCVFAFSMAESANLMWEAHTTGCALCKVEPQEHAEFHRDQLSACSLTATIEPDE